MSELNGPVCPECGTPRASDGTPACSCARRASDARRDTRTAEAAAAEDFDPVRIRPFVALGGDAGEVAKGREVPQERGDLPDPGETPTAGTVFAGAVAERLLPDGDAGTVPRRRRRTLLITGAGVAVAALVTGALVGGLLSYESPARDGAPSDGVRAPVPDDTTGDAAQGAPSESVSSAPAAGSPTSSAGPTATAETPTPTRSATPTESASGSSSGPSATPVEPSAPAEQAPILRFGDSGPEVTELQLRLRQIGYYDGAVDGDYDRQVETAVRGYQLTRVILTDEPGVYGTATRKSLESETS
ncbi:peptidoglycan-binding protein [Streptomyces sp. NPDC056479]|uniref:peptidoglycan-binding domain-containing protein n=1 Tax=unclassified Streptomyces TaxID=2593676 RepID=UPI0036C6188D